MWALACLTALVSGWAVAAGVAALVGVPSHVCASVAGIGFLVQLVWGNLYLRGLAQRCESGLFWMGALSPSGPLEPPSRFEPDQARTLRSMAASSYSPFEAFAVAAVAAPGLWLRSVAAGLADYRRARGRPGPLDLVAEWLETLAGWTDIPLAAARGRFRRADSSVDLEARRRALSALLESMLTGAPPANAVTRAMYRLGPLSWEDALEAARSAAARGWSPKEPLGPYLKELSAGPRRFRTHPALPRRLEWGRSSPAWPLLVTPAALLAGLWLALETGVLGAPLALAGLASTLVRTLRLPLWGAPLEHLARAAEGTRWRGVRVRLEGELSGPRPPFNDARGLKAAGGWVALNGPVGKAGEHGTVRGWLVDGGGRLVVSQWEGRRYFPWLTALAVPAAVSGVGLSLVGLQMLGV